MFKTIGIKLKIVNSYAADIGDENAGAGAANTNIGARKEIREEKKDVSDGGSEVTQPATDAANDNSGTHREEVKEEKINASGVPTGGESDAEMTQPTTDASGDGNENETRDRAAPSALRTLASIVGSYSRVSRLRFNPHDVT